jgi:hypothetical protein
VCDCAQQIDHEFATFAVEASLKARAAAAESYARGLADSAAALSPPLASTGLGIGRSLNGAARSSGGVGAAVRSAFSFFTGAAAGAAGSLAGQLAAASAAEVTFGGDDNESHSSVVTGGFDSFHNALAVWRRSTHKVGCSSSPRPLSPSTWMAHAPCSFRLESAPALLSSHPRLSLILLHVCRRRRNSWTSRSRSGSSPLPSQRTRPRQARAPRSTLLALTRR